MENISLAPILKIIDDPVHVVLLAVVFWLMKMLRDRDKLMFNYVATLEKISTLLTVVVHGSDDDKNAKKTIAS